MTASDLISLTFAADIDAKSLQTCTGSGKFVHPAVMNVKLGNWGPRPS